MARKIKITDISIGSACRIDSESIPFRTLIDMAKILDNLGLNALQIASVTSNQSNYLLAKSLASTLRHARLVVPVDLTDPDSPSRTWEAFKGLNSPRLQVCSPVSTVQMEYFHHKKADSILKYISESVAACKGLGAEVEFNACDFTRSEAGLLEKAIKAALDAGASTISLSDLSGDSLPEEFYKEVKKVKDLLPEGISLGVVCSNKLFLADSCAIAAIQAGADEVFTSAFSGQGANLEHFPQILHAKADICGADVDLRITELQHAVGQINSLLQSSKIPISSGKLHSNEEESSEQEELIPEKYRLESYVINSGNIITSTCNLKLKKEGQSLNFVGTGIGPVDAAFQAVDKLIGCNYELEDFSIRSVSEGRGAMGETIVQLRNKGKLYTGKGLSADIVGSSILAYINAANKIAFEEDKH